MAAELAMSSTWIELGCAVALVALALTLLVATFVRRHSRAKRRGELEAREEMAAERRWWLEQF